MLFELGIEAEDKVTGFQGKITARIEYHLGATQYQLTKVHEGDIRNQWFEEPRVKRAITKERIKSESLTGDGTGMPLSEFSAAPKISESYSIAELKERRDELKALKIETPLQKSKKFQKAWLEYCKGEVMKLDKKTSKKRK